MRLSLLQNELFLLVDVAERADSMLPVEAMKYSANTIADVGYQYEHHTRKLWGRDKCVARHFSVIRRGKKSEAIYGTLRMAAIPSETGNLVRCGDWSALRSNNTKSTMVSQTRK